MHIGHYSMHVGYTCSHLAQIYIYMMNITTLSTHVDIASKYFSKLLRTSLVDNLYLISDGDVTSSVLFHISELLARLPLILV